MKYWGIQFGIVTVWPPLPVVCACLFNPGLGLSAALICPGGYRETVTDDNRAFRTSDLAGWLDGTTTKFYRPLISVFMVSDYVLWNHSAIGFHLTNLLFHLASTAFIFLIARELAALTLIEEKAKIQEECTTKNWKIDGTANWYDQEGKFTIEYTYSKVEKH